MELPCLDKIIGLSQTTCPCFDNGKPVNYNESKSGVFLDELDGFNIELAGAADDCARDGIWERMERAVRNAKYDYRNNLMGCLGLNYKPKIQPLNVQLGDTKFQGSHNYNTSYAGVKLIPAQIKGGIFVLKRVGIMVNATTPVTIKIYSNINNSTLLYQSTPIPAVADTFQWVAFATPLELPMFSYNKNVNYFIVYDLNGTYQPKNNLKDCGCGGVQKPYLQWMDYNGVSGNDINNPENFSVTSATANGIVVDLQIKCKTTDLICSEEYPLDYDDDGYAINLAYAIRFRAGARLYEELLNTTVINRHKLLNREYVSNKIIEWNEEYMKWINYLCANTEMSNNDCMVCRENTATSLVKASIHVTGSNYDFFN